MEGSQLPLAVSGRIPARRPSALWEGRAIESPRDPGGGAQLRAGVARASARPQPAGTGWPLSGLNLQAGLLRPRKARLRHHTRGPSGSETAFRSLLPPAPHPQSAFGPEHWLGRVTRPPSLLLCLPGLLSFLVFKNPVQRQHIGRASVLATVLEGLFSALGVCELTGPSDPPWEAGIPI